MKSLLSRRTSLRLLSIGCVSVAAPMLVGCPAQTPQQVLSDVIAGVEQAQIVISAVEAYLENLPTIDATLKAKIEAALTDARNTLAAVVALGNVITDVTDARFQAALADFSAAFAAVVTLATQIGVQVSTGATTAKRTGSGLIIPEPIILRLVTKAGATR